MKRRIGCSGGILLAVWAVIATAVLVWDMVGSAPWERQGRCLDAVLTWKETRELDIFLPSVYSSDWVAALGGTSAGSSLGWVEAFAAVSPPDEKLSLTEADQLQYMTKAREAMRRWCG